MDKKVSIDKAFSDIVEDWTVEDCLDCYPVYLMLTDLKNIILDYVKTEDIRKDATWT